VALCGTCWNCIFRCIALKLVLLSVQNIPDAFSTFNRLQQPAFGPVVTFF
jgi:hypothetical protein